MADRDRHYEFKAARSSKQPIVVSFDDGRSWEFPPDLPAEKWLNYVLKWGNVEETLDGDKGEQVPLEMALDLYDMVLGDQKDDVTANVSMLEMGMIAAALYAEYMNLLAAVGAAAQGKVRARPASEN